ncbi:MAG: TatD family hydrolase [Phycisphaerae bacterium]
MIDSHCHLTYPQLAGDLPAVLERANAAGVEQLVTIGTGLADSAAAVELAGQLAQVWCTVGIHPNHANEVQPADVKQLFALAGQKSVVAIGECGLDYHHAFTDHAHQAEVFEAQLAVAVSLNMPVVIHCREAVDDTLAILARYERLSCVFHCFTGTLAESRRILAAGYYLGFTGPLTFKRNDELRQVAAEAPADRILVETDAPYLSPEPVRSQKVNEPAFVRHTLEKLAAVRGLSVAEADALTAENTRRFFRM